MERYRRHSFSTSEPKKEKRKFLWRFSPITIKLIESTRKRTRDDIDPNDLLIAMEVEKNKSPTTMIYVLFIVVIVAAVVVTVVVE